jgi:hypothetical protein
LSQALSRSFYCGHPLNVTGKLQGTLRPWHIYACPASFCLGSRLPNQNGNANNAKTSNVRIIFFMFIPYLEPLACERKVPRKARRCHCPALLGRNGAYPFLVYLLVLQEGTSSLLDAPLHRSAQGGLSGTVQARA